MKCPICEDDPFMGSWTDFSGEMNCMKCGIPLQVKWGTDKQKTAGNYPYVAMYLCLAEHFKEYHETTGKRARFGRWMGGPKQEIYKEQVAFWKWMEDNYPEWEPPEEGEEQ